MSLGPLSPLPLPLILLALPLPLPLPPLPLPLLPLMLMLANVLRLLRSRALWVFVVHQNGMELV